MKRSRLGPVSSWWRGAAVAAVAAVVSVIAPGGAGLAGASGTTTTTAPLTLTQWKHSYETSVGKIADDALVVWSSGKKSAKHPTAKKVTMLITSCQRWHDDAETVPDGVPPIPQRAAERAWAGLIATSLSASADCVNALRGGSMSAERDFDRKMILVRENEKTLLGALGSSGT